MIDIWERPLSAAEKYTTETRAIDDVKKIIDLNEIVVFQDGQIKLKSSNVFLDDILTRSRDAADNYLALFEHGLLKPGVLASTITKKLAEYTNHLTTNEQLQQSIIDTIDPPINDFFGVPWQQFDIQLAHVKAAIDTLAKLRAEYDFHVAQFGTLRKNFNVTDNAVEKSLLKKI